MPDSDYLKPTIEGIFEDCPRFRVLVVGRSGVGKSSLINAAFKVDLANVSKLRPGFSNIEQEITTPENPLFVLHDSQGYEPGETQNLGTLKAFIESRSNMPRLADRLHAIWLCIEIPIAGGRVTETGDEALLKLRSELPPSLPFIVVFTKYDQFVSAKEYELLNSLNNLDDMTDDEVEQTVQSRLGQDFADLCLDKLRKVSPELPLWVYVSADARYTETLKGLLGLTHKHIVDSVSIILASAQRVDATAKIDASIAVGRKSMTISMQACKISLTFSCRILEGPCFQHALSWKDVEGMFASFAY
ncbi:hypothetical protein EW026_g1389 [Hermanssonia centrifuga]|uniref:G domain-containing protein n=1 Tax=Hermanssonia centrifuga TaxID=98765 RepID=A0A4S4KRN0_9APHY|nr:hypothetical protein EW026_g1389 [Hermanssonia centrifuga]